MNILVTGTPGSGKTALVRFACTQGDQNFFDADELEGLCEWRSFETGSAHGLVHEVSATKTDAWYKKYGWYWREGFLDNFLKNQDGHCILCGSSENIVNLYPKFDKIFVLKKTESELLKNLMSPDRKNPFGKTPEQRKSFMNWQNHLIKNLKNHNSIIIEGNSISKIYKELCEEID